MKSLTPQMETYYKKKFPGIEFTANEGFVTAHYHGRSGTFKTLTSIDDGVVAAFEPLIPATYKTIKFQVTGDNSVDALIGVRRVLSEFNLSGPEQAAIARYFLALWEINP